MTLAETRAFFDALAPEWDARSQDDPQKLASIATLADIRAGCRVLDIACGTGVLTPTLLSCGADTICAVDLSPAMINIARGKRYGERVRFTALDYFALDEAGFDAAIIYNAYPHFPDKARFAAHTAGLLKPGGRLTIAHGQGRDAINARHASRAAQAVSVGLGSAAQEAAALEAHFAVDVLVDTAGLYVVSGRRL